ncbi:MAG: RNA polymerase sigma factor [Phycisphaerae bacterium]|nr:RNA polymerase sigma factor [Phycisphaerae bacterium]
MDNLSDIELVRKFMAGNRFAFELLYRRHYALVKNTCLKIVRNEQTAAELTQQAFFNALSKIGSLSHDNFIGWLCCIAKNLALNERAKQRLCYVEEDVLEFRQSNSDTDDPAIETQRQEIHQIIKKTLNILPEPTKTYMIEYYLHDMSYGDICEAYFINKNQLDWHLRKGRQILRDKLEGI